MKIFKMMLKTELKLSLRGIDMIIFAIFMPVAILVILGMIYGNRPAFDGAGYSFLEQSFGAVSAIAICAGGVMGLPLVVSDYRHKKILKRFQVTPVSPLMILAVQAAVYALYALVSLALLSATAAVFFSFSLTGLRLLFLAAYLLVMLSMFSIGFMIGGIAPDPKTAGVAASLLYFPMLIFSGTTLPYEILPPALRKAADIMPLTQGIKLLKAAFLGSPREELLFPAAILVAVMIVCTYISIRFFRWE